MKRLLKVLLSLTSIFQSSTYAIACHDGQNPGPSSGIFNLITGTAASKIIATAKYNNTIFALNDKNGVYKSDDDKSFVQLNTDGINDKLNKLVVGNNGELFISSTNLKENKGSVYKYNKEDDKFKIFTNDDLKKPIFGLFVNNNNLYIASRSESKVDSDVYKMSIDDNMESSEPDFIGEQSGEVSALGINKNNKILLGSKTGFIYRQVSDEFKKIAEIKPAGEIVSIIIVEDNIYVLHNTTSVSTLYKGNSDGEKLEKTVIETKWLIKTMVFTNKYFYFGGDNKNLYYSDEKVSSYQVFNKQKIGNITALTDSKDSLIVANSEGKVYYVKQQDLKQ